MAYKLLSGNCSTKKYSIPTPNILILRLCLKYSIADDPGKKKKKAYMQKKAYNHWEKKKS